MLFCIVYGNTDTAEVTGKYYICMYENIDGSIPQHAQKPQPSYLRDTRFFRSTTCYFNSGIYKQMQTGNEEHT